MKKIFGHTKLRYIRPEIEFIRVDEESVCAGSQNLEGGDTTDGDGTGGNEDPFSAVPSKHSTFDFDYTLDIDY